MNGLQKSTTLLIGLFGMMVFIMTSSSPAGAFAPDVQVHQGDCFSYAVPLGWKCNDTPNGVDIYSPDGSQYVFLSVFERGRGMQTPEGFVRIFCRMMKVQSMQIVSNTDGPPAPSFPKTRLLHLTGISAIGAPIRMTCIAGAGNGWGQWSAFCKGYCARASVFDSVSPLLGNLAQSITATGGARIAGANSIMQGINHPNVAGDIIMQGWNYRNGIYDHIAQNRTETIRGITRQQDPTTGTIYDMPLNAYNASRGGYVNPARPTELLQHAQPGE
jgi:hypothetical protein